MFLLSKLIESDLKLIVVNFIKTDCSIKIMSFMHRYPIVSPRENCAGNLPHLPGVRSYGLRPASEQYDVFCYVEGLRGEAQNHP